MNFVLLHVTYEFVAYTHIIETNKTEFSIDALPYVDIPDYVFAGFYKNLNDDSSYINESSVINVNSLENKRLVLYAMISTSLTLKTVYLDITNIDSINYDTNVWTKEVIGDNIYIKTQTLKYITVFPVPVKNTMVDDYLHVFEFNYWKNKETSEACYDLTSKTPTPLNNMGTVDDKIYLIAQFNESISNYSPVKVLTLYIPKNICTIEYTYDYQIAENDLYFVLTKTYQKNKYRDENGNFVSIPFGNLPTYRIIDSNWTSDYRWHFADGSDLVFNRFDTETDFIDLYAVCTREYTVNAYYQVDHTYYDTFDNLRYVDALDIGEYSEIGFVENGYEFVELRNTYYKKLSKVYTIVYGQTQVIGYLPYYTPFNTMEAETGYYTFDKDTLNYNEKLISVVSSDKKYFVSSKEVDSDINIYAQYGMKPDALEVLLLVDNNYGFDIVEGNGYSLQNYKMTVDGREYSVLRQLFVNNGQNIGDLPVIQMKNSEYMVVGYYLSLYDRFAPTSKITKFTELTTNMVAFAKIQKVSETVKVKLYYDYREDSESNFSMDDEEVLKLGYDKEQVLKDKFYDSVEEQEVLIYDLYYYTYAFNIEGTSGVMQRVVNQLPMAYREGKSFVGWFDKVNDSYGDQNFDYMQYMEAVLSGEKVQFATDFTKFVTDDYKTDTVYSATIYAKFIEYSQIMLYGNKSGGTNSGYIYFGSEEKLRSGTADSMEFTDNVAFSRVMGDTELAYVIAQGNVDMTYFALNYDFSDFDTFDPAKYMVYSETMAELVYDFEYNSELPCFGIDSYNKTGDYKFINYGEVYSKLKYLLNDLIVGTAQSTYTIVTGNTISISALRRYMIAVNSNYSSLYPDLYSKWGAVQYSQNSEGNYYFYFDNLVIKEANKNFNVGVVPFKLGIDVTKTAGGANYVKYYFSGFKTSTESIRGILVKVQDVTHKLEVGLTERAIEENQTLTLIQTGEFELTSSNNLITYPFRDEGIEVVISGIKEGSTVIAKIYYLSSDDPVTGYNVDRYGAETPSQNVLEYITFGKDSDGSTKIHIGSYASEDYKILLEYVMNQYTVTVQSTHDTALGTPVISYGFEENNYTTIPNWSVNSVLSRYEYAVEGITHGQDMFFTVECQNGYVVKDINAIILGTCIKCLPYKCR